MENVYRNDIYNFFKDMPTNQQQEAISELNRQIKKPPDSDADKSESEVIQHLATMR